MSTLVARSYAAVVLVDAVGMNRFVEQPTSDPLAGLSLLDKALATPEVRVRER